MSAITDAIADFIAKGVLCGVFLNMSEKDLGNLLGPPQESGVRRKELLLRYGSLDIVIAKRSVVMICCELRDGLFILPLPHGYVREPVVLDLSTLQASGITLTPVPSLTFQSQQGYRSAIGVSVIFTDDGRLDTLCLSA